MNALTLRRRRAAEPRLAPPAGVPSRSLRSRPSLLGVPVEAGPDMTTKRIDARAAWTLLKWMAAPGGFSSSTDKSRWRSGYTNLIFLFE